MQSDNYTTQLFLYYTIFYFFFEKCFSYLRFLPPILTEYITYIDCTSVVFSQSITYVIHTGKHAVKISDK